MSNRGLRCPLTELFDTIENSPNKTLRMRDMNLNLSILRIFEDTFSLGVMQLNYSISQNKTSASNATVKDNALSTDGVLL